VDHLFGISFAEQGKDWSGSTLKGHGYGRKQVIELE
jgi:hypothetical protein